MDITSYYQTKVRTSPRTEYQIPMPCAPLLGIARSIDGKQARRTRSSSPLGQLFDHGCDALSVGLLLDSTHCSMDYPCGYVAAGIVNLVRRVWGVLKVLGEVRVSGLWKCGGAGVGLGGCRCGYAKVCVGRDVAMRRRGGKGCGARKVWARGVCCKSAKCVWLQPEGCNLVT